MFLFCVRDKICVRTNNRLRFDYLVLRQFRCKSVCKLRSDKVFGRYEYVDNSEIERFVLNATIIILAVLCGV